MNTRIKTAIKLNFVAVELEKTHKPPPLVDLHESIMHYGVAAVTLVKYGLHAYIRIIRGWDVSSLYLYYLEIGDMLKQHS